MMNSQNDTSNTSRGAVTCGEGVMSTGGRQGIPNPRTASVSPAVPENNSKKKGPCWAIVHRSCGTSSHESHRVRLGDGAAWVVSGVKSPGGGDRTSEGGSPFQ